MYSTAEESIEAEDVTAMHTSMTQSSVFPHRPCADRTYYSSYTLATITGGRISIPFGFFFFGVAFGFRGVSGPVPSGVAAGESAACSSSMPGS